ncbi:hypothetical protein CH366_10270 [Leptospira harrisiae]|uniref:Uncharacterized protein n=1 Tax=Leptospira harrisiae TaxID=2023189 RepID=A0A2N0AHE1_9LEPT|nr:hypothetical protein CH364_15990 [Leptospira harrisiae]PKA06851.1 hypothetical protein CH366_10270 [Leptospira harrisiae]
MLVYLLNKLQSNKTLSYNIDLSNLTYICSDPHDEIKSFGNKNHLCAFFSKKPKEKISQDFPKKI